MVVIQQYDEGKRIVLISNGKEGMNESKKMFFNEFFFFLIFFVF